MVKPVGVTLKAHPKLNASFDAANEQYILKEYYNIGVAIDTPRGLVAGVIRGGDQKSVHDIAAKIVRLSHKAREKGLSPAEMSDGSFTVSSLGGIGSHFLHPSSTRQKSRSWVLANLTGAHARTRRSN